MKTRVIINSILFVFCLSLFNLTAAEKEVRYLTGFINEIDGNLILLTNNLAWRTDRHVTAMSMQPIIIVLEKDRNEGFLYIKNEKVNVTLMQNASAVGKNKLYVPALNEKLNVYNIGTLVEVEKTNSEKGTIKLSNGQSFKVKTKEDKEELSKWSPGTEVIVSKSNNNIRITNIITTMYVGVVSETMAESAKTTN
ncbi:MAG TPA: hypothetical protein ENN33_04420 [Ignavibacteria bacterium]|nr:hypothetical protein [Ignavibacteria bacterium]